MHKTCQHDQFQHNFNLLNTNLTVFLKILALSVDQQDMSQQTVHYLIFYPVFFYVVIYPVVPIYTKDYYSVIY